MTTSILFMYLGLSLLGIFYFLVYIGAVAVLFLFSIMILEIKEDIIERDMTYFISIFLLIVMLCFELYLFNIGIYSNFYYSFYEFGIPTNDLLKIVGYLIFKEYYMGLFFSGLILLISMIGAIFLTNTQHGFFMRVQRNPMFRNAYLFHTSNY